MSSKGSAFERDVCKQLSLWWSYNHRDDMFWRTSMSGGRATVRGKTGRATHGQYGDITSTHPKGNSLMRLVTIELKRGYSSKSILDIIEKDNTGSDWWKFFKQAQTASKASGSKWWWLIVKRDYHEPMLYMPFDMANVLRRTIGRDNMAKLNPSVSFVVGKYIVAAFRFNQFIETIQPEDLLLTRYVKDKMA